ncbi:MAG TPA: hypothetical protein VJT50_05400 [Pyrinomonadaceae bacterium]|nr:hypothetical protein [Pyrinomonadaceae bacterium]
MWNLFQRKSKGWLTASEYFKHRERKLKRDPQRVAKEREQARLWAIRIAHQREIQKTLDGKGSHGTGDE